MNERIINFRTELKIEARDLDSRCPECERKYENCDCGIDALVEEMSSEGYNLEEAAGAYADSAPYGVLVDALSLAFGISETTAANRLNGISDGGQV